MISILIFAPGREKPVSVTITMTIRFTTYNVLSSHLSDPSGHTGSNPIYLNPTYRYELIKARIEKEIQSDSIIALQEVSHLWAGK